jgi:hypothetical protein
MSLRSSIPTTVSFRGSCFDYRCENITEKKKKSEAQPETPFNPWSFEYRAANRYDEQQ